MHPREYLSHSQKSAWKRSQKEYIKKYVYDEPFFETKEIIFGKKVAHALEHNESTGDPELDLIISRIPKFEKMEHELTAEMKFGKECIKLFGKFDSAKLNLTGVKEYKTGKNGGKSGKCGWTQKKVDEDSQITFYATMCFLITKKIPNDLELVWIITDEDENGQIYATGEIKRFPTKRNMSHIINEMADMRIVWKEIGEAIDKELLD